VRGGDTEATTLGARSSCEDFTSVASVRERLGYSSARTPPLAPPLPPTAREQRAQAAVDLQRASTVADELGQRLRAPMEAGVGATTRDIEGDENLTRALGAPAASTRADSARVATASVDGGVSPSNDKNSDQPWGEDTSSSSPSSLPPAGEAARASAPSSSSPPSARADSARVAAASVGEKRRQQGAPEQGWQTRESEEAGTGEVEDWSTVEDINWPGRPPGPAHGGDKGMVGGTRVDGNSNGGFGGTRSTAAGAPRATAARVPHQGPGVVAGRTFDDSVREARGALGSQDGDKGVGGGTRVDGNSNGGVGGARSSADGGPSVATARDMARDVAARMEEEGGGAVGGPVGDGGMAKHRTASRKCGRWGGKPGKRFLRRKRAPDRHPRILIAL
jgi:hypothetical protein